MNICIICLISVISALWLMWLHSEFLPGNISCFFYDWVDKFCSLLYEHFKTLNEWVLFSIIMPWILALLADMFMLFVSELEDQNGWFKLCICLSFLPHSLLWERYSIYLMDIFDLWVFSLLASYIGIVREWLRDYNKELIFTALANMEWEER